MSKASASGLDPEAVHREAPTNSEYGLAVVDGQRYPDACPGCGDSHECEAESTD